MRTFTDYNPTREEVDAIFGDPDDKETTEYIKFIEGTDSEKFEIARLLVGRGKNEEALKIIATIEDEVYREDMRMVIKSWIAFPGETLW